MAESGRQKASQAREVMDCTLSNSKPIHIALYEISKILNTGLDMETLATCVRLCENGVNPEALTMVIQELRRESAVIKAENSQT